MLFDFELAPITEDLIVTSEAVPETVTPEVELPTIVADSIAALAPLVTRIPVVLLVIPTLYLFWTVTLPLTTSIPIPPEVSVISVLFTTLAVEVEL